MAITLNKYSAVLPNYAVVLIWLVPLVLFFFWIVKEKSKAFVKHFKQTPITYCIMGTTFTAFLWFATPIVKSKIWMAEKPDLPTAKSLPPSTSGHTAVASALTDTAHLAKDAQKKHGARPYLKSENTIPVHSPAVAPSFNVHVDAPDNQGNVAGVNNGTQIYNQCGPPKYLISGSISSTLRRDLAVLKGKKIGVFVSSTNENAGEAGEMFIRSATDAGIDFETGTPIFAGMSIQGASGNGICISYPNDRASEAKVIRWAIDNSGMYKKQIIRCVGIREDILGVYISALE